jgi:DNA-3-methyladenine glycosylase
MKQALEESFYKSLCTIELAKSLLGKRLVHDSEQGMTSGLIVETEAYLRYDPACHASRGRTNRNSSMFLDAGHAYVYFVYGNHFCFNVVSEGQGIGEAVLIRSLEPQQGVELMAARRGIFDRILLTSGPGRLCKAMGIDKKLDGSRLWQGPLYVENDEREAGLSIIETFRIGISQGKDLKLRFLAEGNSFVSRRPVNE